MKKRYYVLLKKEDTLSVADSFVGGGGILNSIESKLIALHSFYFEIELKSNMDFVELTGSTLKGNTNELFLYFSFLCRPSVLNLFWFFFPLSLVFGFVLNLNGIHFLYQHVL